MEINLLQVLMLHFHRGGSGGLLPAVDSKWLCKMRWERAMVLVERLGRVVGLGL